MQDISALLEHFEKLPPGHRRYAFQFFYGLITSISSGNVHEHERCAWAARKLEEAIAAPLPEEAGWWNEGRDCGYDVAWGRKTDGITLIQQERSRQMEKEGYDPDHDDSHAYGEMIEAAHTYAEYALDQVGPGMDRVPAYFRALWPWEYSQFKPSEDPIRNLVKAAALIAAEIDRLQRAKQQEGA